MSRVAGTEVQAHISIKDAPDFRWGYTYGQTHFFYFVCHVNLMPGIKFGAPVEKVYRIGMNSRNIRIEGQLFSFS